MQVWQPQEPFATITSLSELYFQFRRFILLVQMKKVISTNYNHSVSTKIVINYEMKQGILL